MPDGRSDLARGRETERRGQAVLRDLAPGEYRTRFDGMAESEGRKVDQSVRFRAGWEGWGRA